MRKYKKILVAFDGSESSKNALKQAINLAQTQTGTIKVLAVVPSYEGDLELIGVSNIKEVLRGPAEKILSEAKAIAEAKNVTITTNIEQGEPYERIVNTADAENCDIIIMGRRGRHRLARSLMGGVTQRVISQSRKNVLVVPRDSIIKWENIVIATDGSKYSEVAAKEAIVLAKLFVKKCALHAIAVTRKSATEERIKISNNALKEIQSKAEKENIKVDTLLIKNKLHESIHETIIEYAKEKNADITVMGSRGRTGIKRLLMGSVAERVIGYTHCPVLVVSI
jgi:nucleotide-binding universal stress UspA family protein